MEKAIYNIDPSNYFVILRWMIKDLHLSGLKLSVFAIIHGFTQSGSSYDGSLDWIADFLDSSSSQISRTLKELVELNYICKEIIKEKENRQSGGSYIAAGFIHYCKYKSNIKLVEGKIFFITNNIAMKTDSTVEKNAMVDMNNKPSTVEKNAMVNVNKSTSTIENFSTVTIEKNATATVEKNAINNIYNNKFKNKTVVNQIDNTFNSYTSDSTATEIYTLLKKLFKTNELVFSKNFYLNLSNAMQAENITNSAIGSYLKWAYDYASSHCKDSNIADYFYKFATQKYAFIKYKSNTKTDKEKPSEPKNIIYICPVCQTESNYYDNCDCEVCGLPVNKRSDVKEINIYKKIFKLPQSTKNELSKEIEDYFKAHVMMNINPKSSFEFDNFKTKVYQKYGVV